MNRVDLFGNEITEEKHEEVKQASLTPFDFINSINYTKENLIVDTWSEKQYVPFIVNKGLSYSADTAIQANEMNSRPHLDKVLQYNFLINIIRSRKRFNKWMKPQKIEALDVIKQYYGYSNEKAKAVLTILTEEQVAHLKQKLQKGGTDAG